MAVLTDPIKQRVLSAARILDGITPVRAVYVFGSQVEGGAHRWSDIDVAFFLEGMDAWDMRRCAQVMYQVQQGAGLDIEAHLFPARLLKECEPASFAAYIMSRGVSIPLEELVA
jgi:predicted nucleotidyltransferase